VLAYQYLQTLPQLAQGEGNTFWVIPSEVTSALKSLSSAFDPGANDSQGQGPAAGSGPGIASAVANLALQPNGEPDGQQGTEGELYPPGLPENGDQHAPGRP
jgi:hypothetical protein